RPSAVGGRDGVVFAWHDPQASGAPGQLARAGTGAPPKDRRPGSTLQRSGVGVAWGAESVVLDSGRPSSDAHDTVIEGAVKSRVVMAVVALVVMIAAPALAFNCPVVIKQAEDLIRKAEATKTNADTQPLIDRANKLAAK